ncbi:hypothetical protein XELAEV_18024231mg [Xenopus laevis]|uniref:Protein phosphatase 1 regulatory subunit 14B n=1 Tax=Xenopus laevis TaxID=8355 RepID=A0A974HL50_XENLA|nr:hypothetical protein XELAEV_18024231mg [Xenopus laevis]
MAALSSPGSSPHPTSPRVYFQSPGETAEQTDRRHQGKVTVKYDRKELRKRLRLEEWILEQLVELYDCQEEEIPELEIDVDELLDMETDAQRGERVKVTELTGFYRFHWYLLHCVDHHCLSLVFQKLLVDCYKPTEAFISGLLEKIQGMQKLSTPQKK